MTAIKNFQKFDIITVSITSISEHNLLYYTNTLREQDIKFEYNKILMIYFW